MYLWQEGSVTLVLPAENCLLNHFVVRVGGCLRPCSGYGWLSWEAQVTEVTESITDTYTLLMI